MFTRSPNTWDWDTLQLQTEKLSSIPKIQNLTHALCAIK